jgi:hypothetical protein
VLVVNVANPASPSPVTAFSIASGLARDLRVVGALAYVAGGNAGLQVLGLPNPTASIALGGYRLGAYAQAVDVVGELAFLADGDAGLQIVSVNPPTDPRLVGALPPDREGRSGGGEPGLRGRREHGVGGSRM